MDIFCPLATIETLLGAPRDEFVGLLVMIEGVAGWCKKATRTAAAGQHLKGTAALDKERGSMARAQGGHPQGDLELGDTVPDTCCSGLSSGRPAQQFHWNLLQFETYRGRSDPSLPAVFDGAL